MLESVIVTVIFLILINTNVLAPLMIIINEGYAKQSQIP